LEPSKVYLLLEAPEAARDELIAAAPGMSKREFEEAVNRAKALERVAAEATKRAEQAEARAKELAARPAQVVEKIVTRTVTERDPKQAAEIDRLNRQLTETSKDLDKLRNQADKDGLLEQRIRQKEAELKRLADLQRKMGPDFHEPGTDPEGGRKLMEALQPVGNVILRAIGDARLLKERGVGGPCEDEWVKELSDRLKQLAANLDGILHQRANRPLNIDMEGK
jgi:hypothetical protein